MSKYFGSSMHSHKMSSLHMYNVLSCSCQQANAYVLHMVRQTNNKSWHLCIIVFMQGIPDQSYGQLQDPAHPIVEQASTRLFLI